jgi:COP9 signalosome complex subunit 7
VLTEQSLSYDTISSDLGITSIRELENTIIDVIYAGLIGGKMYHQEKTLHIDWVSGRDVTPEALAHTADVLDSWYVQLTPFFPPLHVQAARLVDTDP